MSTTNAAYAELAALVKPNEGRINRRIFGDPLVHEAELERIFARCWLFAGHVSQLTRPGDFVTTMMGEDPVIVTRDRAGGLRVFLNSCSHKGRTVCELDRGNSSVFTCPYHGWRYRSDGSLAGVPNSQDGYYGELDKKSLGLRQARVDTHRGLIFATWDHDAPTLAEYLGDITWFMDIALDRCAGGTELVGPPQRFVVRANWKTGAENFISDYQHAQSITHASALAAMGVDGNVRPSDGVQSNPAPGHGIFVHRHRPDQPGAGATNAAFMAEHAPDAVGRLGQLRGAGHIDPVAGTVFPNLSFNFSPTFANLRMWMPRGPHEMEVWTWGIVDADVSDAVKRTMVAGFRRSFGASGLLEQDDAEQWQAVSASSRGYITRNEWSFIGMGLGHEFTKPDVPGDLGQLISESNARAFYRRWQQMILADTWDDCRSGLRPAAVGPGRHGV